MSKASDRAYHQIRTMILSGELSSGERLSEEQLAEVCGVSRTPVRDALRRLEAEMFIRRTDSQRSFVADWGIDEVEDAFTLRGMLEGHAAARAATRIEPAQLAALKHHNDAIGAAIRQNPPNVPDFLEHNRAFHATILEAAGSERLSGMLARLVEQPVIRRTAMHYDREDLARSWREHDELLLAFTRRDAAWAHAIMAGHIRRAFHTYADAHRRAREASGTAELPKSL